jgi:O-antigen/teichoic acid export membrane protein
LSIFTKFLKGSLLLSFASLVVRLSGILVLIPLARLLGPEKLGVYSLVFWLVQTGTTLGRLGVDAAMHRNGSQLYQSDPVAAGRIFGAGSTLMGLSFTVLSIVIWIWRYPLATHWLSNKDAIPWFSYGAIILFLEGISLVAMTGLLSLHNFKAHALATSVGSIVRLLLSPILAWSYGLPGALLGLVLASLLQFAVAAAKFWQSIQQHQICLSYQNFWQESQRILKFGLPFYAGNALIGLVTMPMMGELGRVAGVEALGQLRIGQSLSQIVSFVPSAISPVAISVLSQVHEVQSETFQQLRSLHLRGNWLLALIGVMLLNIISNPLINLLFGDFYKAAIPLVISMNWVILLTVVVESLNLYSLSAGRTGILAIGSIVQKLVFISFAFWLIPHLGGLGFVIGLLVGSVSQFIIMTFTAWRNFEASLKQKFFILSILSLLGSLCNYATLSNLLNSQLITGYLFASFSTISISILSICLVPTFTERRRVSQIKKALFFNSETN